MATVAQLPFIGSSGDITPHRTVSAPGVIYIMRHNVADATGNATPAGDLDHNPDGSNDALMFGYEIEDNIADSGLQDVALEWIPSDSDAAQTVPNKNSACIGLTSGGVNLRKEQDTIVFNSDQLRGNYDEDAVSNSWSVDCTMDEMTLWNLALAWGRAVASIGSSSLMLLKAGDQEFHSMQVITKAPQLNFKNSVGHKRRASRVFQLFKVKAWSNGDISMTRDAKQGIPVLFSTYCDGNENWGFVFDMYKDFTGSSHTSELITAPTYNTQPSDETE